VTNIDKQRVAAVRKLEQLGYRYDGGEWVPPASAKTAVTQHSILAEADALLSALVLRADALEGCIEGSEEQAELAVITDAIEAYEAIRCLSMLVTSLAPRYSTEARSLRRQVHGRSDASAAIHSAL